MKRVWVAAVLVFGSCCCLAEEPGGTRYPAAYPEPDAVAAWRSLGASFVRKAINENKLERDRALNARVDRVMSAIGAAATTLYPNLAPTIWKAILIEGFGHGAAAFPGNTILVDAKFVRDFAVTDDEMALIFAHEVAHIVGGHPSEKLAFMAGYVGKDKAPTAHSALLEFLAQDGYAIKFLPTELLQEREADAIGAGILYVSGYDAPLALQLFDKLDKAQRAAGQIGSDSHDPAWMRKQAISRLIGGFRQSEARLAR